MQLLRLLCLISGVYFSSGFIALRYNEPRFRGHVKGLTLRAAQNEDYFLPLALKPYPLNLWVRRRSEEHTSELQSLMRITYAVFCLKKKNITTNTNHKTTIIKTT